MKDMIISCGQLSGKRHASRYVGETDTWKMWKEARMPGGGR